ncbi:alcohol dehydrogenase catalytic domain-containing protein [Nocardioides sp.]|uniref:zinc-dependent alcohol dehydrogenase n=1 Tax=Nocardioides sp. TaxID=35761 RepID=UPI001A31F348|nr:alcohol dehydrogenase catalytic domain-containing protein [Nocardioides sp.]MBJ7355792.1 alcohol dehydrogenase catalytic domain-containing protein [Nocardioides sp.]
MQVVARLHAVGDLRVEESAGPPAPLAGWSTVAVTSVGLCGSDLHWFADGGTGEVSIDAPVVPGHELAGVALDGPYAGRRVAVDPAIPCGRCESCRAGHANLCPEVRFAGHQDLDGGLQERLLWPDELLVPLPDSLSDDAGALLEPLGVAIHAVKHAHVRPGHDVLVVGAGPLGVLAGAVARRAGAARVLVSEPLEHRRLTALRFGADAAWAPDSVQDEVMRATAGRGVDVVVEMAGTDDAIATAVMCARPGARVALGGIPSTPQSAFPAAAARRKGLTFAMVRRMHDTYAQAVELATTGIDLDGLVSDRFPLGRSPEAFEHAVGRTGDKTVIVVSRS